MTMLLVVSLVLAVVFYFYLYRYDARKGLFLEIIFGGPFIWVLALVILFFLGIKKIIRKIRGY